MIEKSADELGHVTGGWDETNVCATFVHSDQIGAHVTFIKLTHYPSGFEQTTKQKVWTGSSSLGISLSNPVAIL